MTKHLLNVAGYLLIGYFAIAMLGRCTPRDDTDGDNRSGMGLHTDARTGCQYLSVPFGGITPRLGPNGEHLCKP